MLTGRTVTASDVPTLGAPTEMKPPAFRGRRALYAPLAAWFRGEINSAVISLHVRFVWRLVEVHLRQQQQPLFAGNIDFLLL